MRKKFRVPPPIGSSYSNEYLNNRNSAPQVSALMVNGVSQERRQILSDEVAHGIFRDGTGPSSSETGLTQNSNVTSLVGFKKNAQVVSGGTGGFRGLSGDSVKQIPEVYSPLWLSSNLNLPRDRATINAWCRAFYALNPFVHNAINLHSTYPISKLSIKCANKEVEKFFNDMIEETDLMNICVQIAQEYWLLGEAFVYGELDQNKGKWSRFLLQNPDYMVVKRTVIANEPMIMLRPDENLKRIVFSNKPSDIEQRKQLNQHIVDSVRRGENIPLNNFHVSHLARKISPYEIRGTGLPVCIFRQLMLFDKLRESKYAQADNMINPLTLVKIGNDGVDGLHPSHADLEAWREVFECHDEETEVLTDSGFKTFDQIIEYQEAMDGTYGTSHISNIHPKSGVKIACFNAENEQLEYHYPKNASLYNYDGNMYHFANDKMDIKITPNHKMWVSEKEYEYNGHRSKRKTKWGDWKAVEAKDLKLTDYSRFRSEIVWEGKEDIQFVDVCGKQMPVELYLEFLGYLISEGCLYSYKSQNTIGICQSVKKYHRKMAKCFDLFMKHFDKSYSSSIRKRGNYSDMWSATACSKELYNYFKKEIGDSAGNVKAEFKCIPRWILELSPRLLNIILQALVDGDGSRYDNPKKESNRFAYYSTSKQLADDVYETAYKCGYVPTSFVRDNEEYINRDDTERLPLHTILWSSSNKGRFPLVYKTSRNSETKEKHDLLKIEKYNGKVWCFEVPTGLFITRRNGKITIQKNSAQYDKDFKIFTHPGVSVERVGYGQGIYDISGDITQLCKEIYVGLQVPPVLMDGGADTTYANGGVALDVLRQRYMQFRNMLSLWLKVKVFAPISELQGFYEYKEGGGSRKTEKQLIIPEVDWNHMSLFDAGDYITNLVTLTAPNSDGSPTRVSIHTLYKSLGLEWEDEQRKIRKEAIQAAITKKETEALTAMPLNSLRALGEDPEIPEPVEPSAGGKGGETAVPGETSELPPPDAGLPGLPGIGNAPPPQPPAPSGNAPPPK